MELGYKYELSMQAIAATTMTPIGSTKLGRGKILVPRGFGPHQPRMLDRSINLLS